MIENYLESSSSGRKLKLIDAFSLEREGEKKIFNP